MDNLLILNLSPNIKGASYKLAKQILLYTQKFDNNVELININELKIHPCGSCVNYCYKFGKCIIKDDMAILYKHFENDKFFIFVTPVYFYHIPGYAKLMIDRCQPYWVRKYVIKNLDLPQRMASVVCIGATKGEQLFLGINLTMKYFFDIFNVKFVPESNLYLKNVETSKELYKYKKQIEKYLRNITFIWRTIV